MTGAGLILYGRERCHLCEEMFEDLQPLLRDHEVVLTEIDVDSDPALRARYGTRVPVLVSDNEELCSGRIETSVVLDWLQGLASGPSRHP